MSTSKTPNPAAGRSDPATIAIVEAFAARIEALMVALATRWEDESETEDLAQYGERLFVGAPANVKLLRMSRQPFGVVIQIDGAPQHYLIYCNLDAGEFGWTRADRPSPSQPRTRQ